MSDLFGIAYYAAGLFLISREMERTLDAIWKDLRHLRKWEMIDTFGLLIWAAFWPMVLPVMIYCRKNNL